MIRRQFFDWPRTAGGFIFVLTLTVTALPAAVDDSARVYFEQAIKSKQEGDYLRAESLLHKAVNLQPENPDFHFELANLYIEQNHFREARMQLEQLVMSAPDRVAAHYNLGLVYKELGMMGEARSEFRKVLELEPVNMKAQLQIGYVYQEEGFFDDARQAFQRAREMDRTHPEPQNALEDLGRFEEESRERQSNLGPLPGNSGFLNPSRSLLHDTQPDTQESMAQAGALLMQQFVNRRSQSEFSNDKDT